MGATHCQFCGLPTAAIIDSQSVKSASSVAESGALEANRSASIGTRFGARSISDGQIAYSVAKLKEYGIVDSDDAFAHNNGLLRLA